MKKILLRRENLMLILVISILVLVEIFSKRTAFDFHFYDTYFIIEKPYFFLAILLCAVIIYACYFLLRKNKDQVSKLITVIQISGLLLSIVQMSSRSYYEGLAGMPRRYYDFSVWASFKDFGFTNKWATFSVIYFIFSQALFFIYFLIMLMQHFYKRK